MQPWFETPPGQVLYRWEQGRADALLADVFGFHALQLGMGNLHLLRANRMPHRWLAAGKSRPGQPSLACDAAALPFPENSLDLVVLPHTLELNADPHGTLREVERVLVPEGRVLIFGLNPASLWGLRQRRARLLARFGLGRLFLPEAGEFIGYWRLRDWLRLLSFEVETSEFGVWRPAFTSERWLQRFEWMEPLGERSWPILGAVYCLMAVKRVRGMRLIGPAWKPQRALASAPVSVANRAQRRRSPGGDAEGSATEP